MESFGKMGLLGRLRENREKHKEKHKFNNKDKRKSDNKDKHKFNQAIIARKMKMVDQIRLLGVLHGKADNPGRSLGRFPLWPRIKESEVNTGELELRMEEGRRVIKLACVMFPCNSGYRGSLEVHLNGFLYCETQIDKYVPIPFVKIETCFFRFGDKKLPPILHFQMRQPILIPFEDGNSQTRYTPTTDVEFQMVVPNIDDNKELKKFVETSKSPLLFDELEKEYEFCGVLPSGGRAAFVVTMYDLIMLVENNPPFTVIPWLNVEFVNLAQVRPGEIDMAVILQESESAFGVLEIRSIPLECLARIKDCLNFIKKKYYVNTKEVDWEAIIKDIAAFPLEFIIKGGWDELEDPETLAYYDQAKELVDIDHELVDLLH